MRRYGYVFAFALVLLAVCAGAYFGGRFLVQRFQQDFQPRPAWTPAGPTAPPRAGQAWTAPALTVDPAAQGPAPTPTRPVIPTPAVPPTPTFAPVPSVPPVDRTPQPAVTTGLTETPSPEPTALNSFPYVLARPMRHSSGDCPGSYVLGQVTDRAGNGLPDVRLRLVDEYGNWDTKVTKSGAGEVGRYDFPLFGAPRRFYLTVVDASGNALSAPVEIPHGVGANPGATCHWVDWRQQ
ncbi:MAG: hypothetical protein CVU38_07550 [Chloroflexi bacterium HGW-Chloroflexi-1]|nr:MAG: hypothetical protein CVU38_07550 [Chloroflexi bacterium HGW-Chloroflexi-1]